MLPTRSALEHKIHELLNYRDNEKIVWMGVPGPLWAPRKTNKLSLAFVLISCVIGPALLSIASFSMGLPANALPALLIILLIASFCGMDLIIRRNIIYALTDRRAILMFLWPIRRVIQVDLDRTPEVTATSEGEYGTVSFAGVHEGIPYRWFGAEAFLLAPQALQEPVFFDVAKPKVVRDTAVALSRERDGQVMPTNSVVPGFGHIFLLFVHAVMLPVLVYSFVGIAQVVTDPKFSMFPDW